ncbi:MAG: response regulator [Acidobacteria bacterium]|nr:response regulator [Acidobacteriota bacterium]
MTPLDPNDVPAAVDPDDPESAMRDARQRFIAAFPKRSDSIGFMLGVVSTIGVRGPLAPLRQIVHRTAGLAGTLGFPNVSISARQLEELLDGVESGAFDPSMANQVFDALEQAFTDDLASPPDWVGSESAAGGNRRVMVVEDDEDQREVVCINLRSAGYVAIPVPAGDQALEVAKVQRPDLILLDANLPGMDGYTVCRLLKMDPDLAGTPVIFMTVRASLDDRMVGLMLGADDYLIKPVEMPELMLRIQVLLSRRTHRHLAPIAPSAALPADQRELDFESFAALAREQLGMLPGTLALIKLPEARLIETYAALRAESRRRDIVACYDPSHLILLLVEMPPAKARDRLTEVLSRLGPGDPPRFQVGLASSAAGGSKTFEAMLNEADQAIAVARQRVMLVASLDDGAAAAPAGQERRGTVVIADDDPEVMRLIDAQLRAGGYRTILAVDGSEAIAAVEQARPDMLIVDMMMPRMTGFDVLSAVRHQPARPRVIVLSARGREQDITRAFALGADDYITKPFSPQELLARMERLLR